MTTSSKSFGSLSEILRIALPLVISTGSLHIMTFFNRVILSWYSTDALSAHTPGMILTFNIVCFFMGVATYTNVLVAQFYGNRQIDNMTRSLWQGFFFALLSAIVIIALIPVGIYIIGLSAHTESIKQLEIDYFTIACAGGGIVVVNHAFSAFFTGRSLTLVTMVVTVLGNIFAIISGYILVFGNQFLHIPDLGIKGAAWGVVLGNAFIAITYSFLILSKKNRVNFKTWELMRFNKEIFGKLMRFGLPDGVGMFIDIAAFALFIFLLGNAGKEALAASNITLSLEGISFMPILGVSIATSTLVGQYIGKGMKDVAIKVVYKCVAISFCYAFTMGILFFFVPNIFVGLFTMKSSEDFSGILTEAYPLLKVLLFFITFDVFNVTFGAAIKGAGDTKFKMKVQLLASWLFFVPGSVFLLSYLKLSVFYGWIWASLFVLILGVAFFLRFRSDVWQKIDMLSPERR